MDGMKEAVKFVGVWEEEAEDKVGWRQMIGCGISWQGAAQRSNKRRLRGLGL